MEARSRSQQLFQYFWCSGPECQSARIANHSNGSERGKASDITFRSAGQADQEGKLRGHSDRHDGDYPLSRPFA